MASFNNVADKLGHQGEKLDEVRALARRRASKALGPAHGLAARAEHDVRHPSA